MRANFKWPMPREKLDPVTCMLPGGGVRAPTAACERPVNSFIRHVSTAHVVFFVEAVKEVCGT